jgi:hypothetical protein
VFLLEANGRHGHYKLWLDPEVGYNPRRIEVRKQLGDLAGKKPLGSRPHDTSVGLWPEAREVAFELIVDSIAVDSLQGAHVITHFTQTQTQTFEQGATTVWKSVHSLSEIKLNPAFSPESFHVEMEIPNGTSITVDGEPNIQYRWYDGKIARVANPAALQNLRTAEYLELDESHAGRRITILTAILLVVAGLGCWHLRRRRVF